MDAYVVCVVEERSHRVEVVLEGTVDWWEVRMLA